MIGTMAIAVGLLILVAGLVGDEPVRFASGEHQYYQLVFKPPALWWLWGMLGISAGWLVLAVPSLINRLRG